MTDKLIKAADIPGLADNIRIMYKLLHPNGLDEASIEKRAETRNFYKIILMKYRDAQEAVE